MRWRCERRICGLTGPLREVLVVAVRVGRVIGVVVTSAYVDYPELNAAGLAEAMAARIQTALAENP